MLNKKPMVSICIPTYNGSRFIKEAMDSAIIQSYSNLEIIVSDDYSEDNTLEIIKTYKNKTNTLIHIYNHKPNGIGANWNNCIRKANGKYVKFLFQDDILEPTCVEEMVNVLENSKFIGLVASKRTFIIQSSYLNEETKKWISKYNNLQEGLQLPLINGVTLLDKKLFKSDSFLKLPLNKIGEPSVVLFNKNIINEVGYFSEDLMQVLDYEFYYRILKKYKIAILEKELVKFRLHDQQASNINSKNDISDYKKYNKLIYKKYFWYLNRKQQKKALKKYNPLIKVGANLLLKIKRKLSL